VDTVAAAAVNEVDWYFVDTVAAAAVNNSFAAFTFVKRIGLGHHS